MTHNNNRVSTDEPQADKNDGYERIVEGLQSYRDGTEELIFFERFEDDKFEREHGSNGRWIQSDTFVEVKQ